MRAVYKAPGLPAIVIDVKNNLKTLQVLVGGDIQAVHEQLDTRYGRIEYVVIVNEDGRWLNMPENIESAFGPAYVGPVLAVGEKGEDFAGLTPDEARSISANFDARAVISAREMEEAAWDAD